MATATQVYTIGHSTHPLEEFMKLLRMHGVTAIADVRSVPHSRFNPQFSKEALERALVAEGITYRFLGKELGARSDDRSCYEDGRVQYGRLAQTALFKQGIERVKKGAQTYRVALLCAEKEPLECHRTLLVSRALEREGMAVSHILGDGRLEPHGDAMLRLLALLGMPPGDLFRSTDALIADAYNQQEQKIAYVDEKLARESREQAAREVEKSVRREVIDGGVLLCSEHKPQHCHRRLVAEYLSSKWGDVEVTHLV